MTFRKLSRLIACLALILAIVILPLPPDYLSNFFTCANATEVTSITRADAALYIAETLGLEHTDDPETLYGLAYKAFPGDYDGKNDVTNYDKEMTLEVAIVTLVRYAGWGTVQYDEEVAKSVEQYVTPEGFPYYQPDPTPRSIPYVVVALDKGLLYEDELPNLRSAIGYYELDIYLERLVKIESSKQQSALLVPESSAEEANNGKNEFVVMDASVDDAESLYSGEDTVIDFRSSGLRIYRGMTGVSGEKQNYFPLGPLESVVEVGLEIPETSYTHQSEGVYSTVNNYSKTTNAVALWGEAVSSASEARVWGGFLTATSKEGMDSQLVGLEVDVTNDSQPGVSPNESKVGMQVVALGKYECTNGIELLAAGNSSWNNGILISEGTISESGTILGSSQSTPVKTGIDFTNTPFTNAALAISNNSKITMQSKSGNPAAIYTDDIDDGYLVLQAGRSGIRITNNENDENLMIIHADGTIEADFLSSNTAGNNNTLTVALAVVMVGFLGYIVYLNSKLKELQKMIRTSTQNQ